MRASGLHPSHLMRPPYGAIDARVRRVVHGLGLVPVLWDVDPRDWAGGSARTIARRVLAGLRPHLRNIVLQHDGVQNSPATIAAVPRIVRVARSRGYCFVALDEHGQPATPA
jgi:peptidoglycan/xylan/chitin deacetylase (PgdA/CDA1 family)